MPRPPSRGEHENWYGSGQALRQVRGRKIERLGGRRGAWELTPVTWTTIIACGFEAPLPFTASALVALTASYVPIYFTYSTNNQRHSSTFVACHTIVTAGVLPLRVPSRRAGFVLITVVF